MDVEVGEPSRVGRISAVSEDGLRLWIELVDGSSATVDSDGEIFAFSVGDVVLLREDDDYFEAAPASVWPHRDENGPIARWAGVVKLRREDVTVVDGGGRWHLLPTNTEVQYEAGNTVEASTADGVIRVLDPKPLRWVERSDLDDDIIDEFLLKPSDTLSFNDFGGLPAVVQRARELTELPLERHDKLTKIGADPIKGVLFTGPPGTGKTMLARIIASEARATFYAISGPTIFSKWYGESEEILRRIFTHAAEHSPAIIFFDEIDSVAGQRTEDAHEASKRVVAQLLTLMDGMSAAQQVTIIAATNRPQDIDVALRRPGRFDWQIEFPLPTVDDREAILRVKGRALATRDPLPYAWVAAQTEGWSAAELAAIWKEAALLSAADDRDAIMTEDFLGGHDRVTSQRRQLATDQQRGAS
ncbi:AAA family ATPase [Conexibacter sp. CPCC 206217]|uniref:AAA family ATPase n=1 Tax=Conexibacter sp. CPCC 206217 TaxID=3064574 RepID=UPI0027168309|nr:AAA family ATPase [Conexibacter sp. CPCC 206217]MDO8210265.1 AAA family ATPase [Conexibacter sp. CPCC 206217]